jgi:hypothetical protein
VAAPQHILGAAAAPQQVLVTAAPQQVEAPASAVGASSIAVHQELQNKHFKLLKLAYFSTVQTSRNM